MLLAEINGSVGAFNYFWILVVLVMVGAALALLRAHKARRSRE